MKYMMAKVLYGAVGILLAAACICTGEKKLSQTCLLYTSPSPRDTR